jgi:hypothetical protein
MHLTPSPPGQGFLAFVPELEVIARQQVWESKKSKKSKVVVGPVQLKSNLDLDLLDLPLFKSNTAIEDLLDGDPIHEEVESVVEAENRLLDVEVEYEWSEEGVVDLHYALLTRSLQRLEAQGNGREKLEILDWIFQPDVPDELVRVIDGKVEKLLVPFTFGTCCRLEGADPAVMRETLAYRCRQIGLVIS